MTCDGDVKKFFREVVKLSDMPEEYLYMIALDVTGTPLGLFEISHGTMDYTVVDARSVFLRALLVGAASVIFIHNHPSGSAEPSDEDNCMVTKMTNAGNLLGIRVLDSIIVTSTSNEKLSA